MRRSRGWRIWVPLVTLWIVWGSTYLGTSVSVQSMPPLISAGSRYFLAALPLAAGLAVIAGPGSLRVTRSQLRTATIMGLGIIGVWAASSSLSQRYLPSGIAALIGASIPLWVVLLRMSSGDRPPRVTVIGVGIGIVGVGLMLLPGGITPVGGASQGQVLSWAVVMLFGSLSWAYFSWRSKAMDVPPNSLVTATYQLLIAGTAVMIVGFATGERVDVHAYSTASWFGWGWLILASILGYTAFTFLIANAPISLVTTFPYVNPVVAVLLGGWVLSEPLTRSVLIGLTVVIGGVVLVVSGERRAASSRSAS